MQPSSHEHIWPAAEGFRTFLSSLVQRHMWAQALTFFAQHSGWLGPNAFEVRVSGGGCAIKESVRNPAEGVVFFWTGACHRGERERGETYKPSLPYVDLRS